MGSSADENRKHAWDTVIRELITKGEVSEDVLYDSDAIIRWWRSLDPTKQEEIASRVEELSQGIFAEVPKEKTRLEAPSEARGKQGPKERKKGCLGCLGMVAAFIIIVVVINLSSSENPRYIYQDGGIHVGADGKPIELVNNPDATNPTYAELVAFIKEDTSDSGFYSEGFESQGEIILARVCADFAEDVHNNAEANGIRAAWVSIAFTGGGDGHAINAFETTDRGLVYVDCTGASFGERLRQILKESSSQTTSRDSIAYLEIGKEYGCISIDKAKSPSYSFYDEYKQKWQERDKLVSEFNEELSEFNEEVIRYNQEIREQVYFEGSSELARIEAWEARIDAWEARLEQKKQVIEELAKELGDFRLKPLRIVEDIYIRW